jgi:DNA-binding NtrC family response regulator
MDVPVQSPRALVVDDDVVFANALRDALRGRGYACAALYTVASAIDAVESNTFDVVVSDLKIGTTSGLLLLSEVRARSPGTIAILMTGWTDPTWPRLMQNGWVDGYVLKPFAIEVLCSAIERAQQLRSGQLVG